MSPSLLSRILAAMGRWVSRERRRRLSEAGYAAVMVAVVVPTIGIGCAAVAVDTGMWYVEIAQVQKAADAAALAGVPYLPQDLPSARARALEVAARNGYGNSGNNTVTVGLGDKATQLRVEIRSTITNTFGTVIGVPNQTITRAATADYQGPAPMGSPCNTFGNEPNAGNLGIVTPKGTAQGSSPPPNCSRTPSLWGIVEAPDTDKVQGDRYQTTSCATGTAVDGCDGGKNNTEYDDYGYVFVVKVAPEAVGTSVKLQLFDPMYVNTGSTCSLLPSSTSFPVGTTSQQNTNVNTWVTNKDAVNRYTSDGNYNGDSSDNYCPGDNDPEGGTPKPMTTTFVLRQQTDTQNPKVAPVQNGSDGQGCIKQYGSYNSSGNNLSANSFKTGTGYLGDDIVGQFHNWVDFCTFTPQRSGDYYLQVRTNLTMGGSGSTYIKSGNSAAVDPMGSGNTTSGNGENAFAIRAVTASGKENKVSVSGYNHMPIFMNAAGSTATFNLIRVLPGAAGQKISFSFFDAGDATGSGTAQVLPPTDATGSSSGLPYATNCTAYGGKAGGSTTNQTTYSDCKAPFAKSYNNGKTETITIPIPTDYSCNFNVFSGCWYRVQVAFPGASSVTDVTTWDATVLGDPVRLIK